ncbi:winged helix-turn-helix domain-containing protein [Sphingomonas immobilis]|uniref:Winged helix-turn-helix domain-containing protein n=1 Tax=Sphingomonas immobilis TaxID=3063997 RepID=A0ABT8ZWB8_9SPHN|nr:winged helix-turn-helix domain-containing protein [Sphingomonas sp. CA1-15]MDO7841870.1 winged helix-turn-helix domain-containing protein [Sphingomonas sp. CA1-15]
MAEVLVLISDGQHWPVHVAQALSSYHAIKLIPVSEPGILMDRTGHYDLSILPIGVFELALVAVGRDRLGAIVVVAERSDEYGCVAAFAGGAADCVSPDMPGAELRARITGILRRRSGVAPGPQLTSSSNGHWYLNVTRRYLVSPAGNRVELPGSTFEVLVALADRPRRILSRSFLVSALNNGRVTSARNVDVIVTRLRQALDRHARSGSSLIATVRNE